MKLSDPAGDALLMKYKAHPSSKTQREEFRAMLREAYKLGGNNGMMHTKYKETPSA